MILAIDIGGTAAKMALVDGAGAISARFETTTCIDSYRVPVMDAVIAGIEAFLRDTGASPEGIAVSATGQVDTESGTVIGTDGKIPGYEGTPVRALLEEKFHVPVTVLNDANAAALGECFAGRGRGCKNVVMVTLGTGIGGGVVIDSAIYGGNRGIAGEIGHFTLYQNGPRCSCGKRGCFELYASAAALVRCGIALTGETALTGKTIFGRAGRGDARMLSLIDQWTDNIAAGISGLIHIFSPELVLVGGGVSSQEKLLMEPLREKVKAQLMPRFAEKLNLQAAALGNDAGMIGAAAYWMKQYAKREDLQ